MAEPLWKTLPDSYARCERCQGTGDVACRWCEGTGGTFGPNRYVYAGTLGRRFGLKRCTYCGGRGKQLCRACMGGSVARPATE